MRTNFLLLFIFLLPKLNSNAPDDEIKLLLLELTHSKTTTDSIDLLNKISYAHKRLDPVFVEEYAQRALNLSLEHNYCKGLSYAYKNLGTAHYKYVSKPDQIIVAMPTSVCGDRIQLHQLFLNLIQNAIKFKVEDQNPLIEIGANEYSGEYKIWIKDNGVGIPQKYHETIFLLFKKLSNNFATQSSGMGLSIAKKSLTIIKDAFG